jgi:pyruvate dehydrogenase E1 component alpha subunit
VGVAWAHKMRKEDRVTMTFFSDGATSTGDFHEAMNFASLFKVPCVICCVNNGFAISVPCCKQTASQTFAQKALAYGMPTVQVDGNDVFAVYKAHRDAIDRARRGDGPSFIEAVTYRLGDHTTADDARRYRDPAEYEAATARDPLVRTRLYLESKGLWDDARQRELDQRAGVIVHEVVDAALNIPAPTTEDLFRFTFEELPEDLLRQMQTLRTDSIGQDPEQIGLSAPPAASSPSRSSDQPQAREPHHA